MMMDINMNRRDELSVVVAVLWTDVSSSVLKKVVHGRVGVVDDLNLISFNPDLNADQSDVHVERPVQLVTNHNHIIIIIIIIITTRRHSYKVQTHAVVSQICINIDITF